MDGTETVISYEHPAQAAREVLPERRRRLRPGRPDRDNMLSARAVVISVLLGAAIWAVAFTVIWLTLR